MGHSLDEHSASLRGSSESTPQERLLQVVTVLVGNAYADVYVDRLCQMVARHLRHPHRFVVFADGVSGRRFNSPGIEVRDCSSWGLPGYFNKLRLFDQAVTGPEPFLYLDVTLFVRGDLGVFFDHAQSRPASLVAVHDWNWPVLNSSVCHIRPDGCTQRVWEYWERGERFGRKFAGDQNYIDAVFRHSNPGALSHWPAEWVLSYQNLRKQAARDEAAAQRLYQRARIIKFHGHPKPPEVLAPWRNLSSTIFRHPFQPRLWRYLASEIRQHWIVGPADRARGAPVNRNARDRIGSEIFKA
ncbi:MAG: hypothetical protein JJT96_02925 [Opitutales bacterium]|nr:hypothetical protein [Opitutales bacterium]